MEKSQLRNSAALIVLSAGIVLGWFGSQLVNSPRAKTEQQRYDRTQAAIADLRQELEQNQALALTAQSNMRAKSLPSVEDAPASPLTPQPSGRSKDTIDERPTAADIAVAEINDDLNSQLQAESVDSGWSLTRRQVIQQRLGKALPAGSRVVSVDCRSSMCRADIEHQNMDDHLKFIHDAFSESEPAWEGSTMVSVGNATGSTKVASVAFLAREGQGLALEADRPQL